MNSDGSKKLNSIDRAQLPHISNGKGQVLFNKHFASQTKVQHQGMISVRLEQEELHINSRDDVTYTGSAMTIVCITTAHGCMLQILDKMRKPNNKKSKREKEVGEEEELKGEI